MVSISKSVQEHLPPELRGVIEKQQAIVLAAQAAQRVPVKQVRFDTFTDPEEGWTDIICTVFVQASPLLAMGFWTHLSREFGEWRKTLPPEQAALIVRKFFFDVFWDEFPSGV